MISKKMVRFLMLIMSVMICFCSTCVLAQQEEEIAKIKKRMVAHLEAFTHQDWDVTMSFISRDYSATKNVSYAGYEDYAKKVADKIQHKYVDFSISNLEIIKADFQNQGNKATIEIEFDWKAFDLDALKDVSSKARRKAALQKENGSWKIIEWIYENG